MNKCHSPLDPVVSEWVLLHPENLGKTIVSERAQLLKAHTYGILIGKTCTKMYISYRNTMLFKLRDVSKDVFVSLELKKDMLS